MLYGMTRDLPISHDAVHRAENAAKLMTRKFRTSCCSFPIRRIFWRSSWVDFVAARVSSWFSSVSSLTVVRASAFSRTPSREVGMLARETISTASPWSTAVAGEDAMVFNTPSHRTTRLGFSIALKSVKQHKQQTLEDVVKPQTTRDATADIGKYNRHGGGQPPRALTLAHPLPPSKVSNSTCVVKSRSHDRWDILYLRVQTHAVSGILQIIVADDKVYIRESSHY